MELFSNFLGAIGGLLGGLSAIATGVAPYSRSDTFPSGTFCFRKTPPRSSAAQLSVRRNGGFIEHG